MGVRVSQIALLASTALSGKIRVSQTALSSALAFHGQIRISQIAVAIPMSANRAFFANTLQSSSTIPGIDHFTVELTIGPVPEHNPYRPTIPESVIDSVGPEFYDYAKENQEIQREQHDITQAGDSTFPFDMFLQAHDSPHFKLGAIGRFYHDTYGIILARYVQFSKMQTTLNLCSPVGLLKSQAELSWVVTNRLDKSDPDLVVGLLAPVILPTEGQYGWVIVDGPNLQSVGNTGDSIEIGQTFAWSQTGYVSNDAQGRIIGRRVNKTDDPKIMAGHLWVQLESLSLGDIQAQIDARVADLRELVETLSSQVAVLDASSNAKAIAAIQKSITQLGAKLNLESGARAGGDAGINKRIDNLNAVTLAQLNTALGNLQQLLQNQITGLTTNVAEVRDIASRALELADNFNPAVITDIQRQIQLVLEMLANEIARPKGKFPLVDGAVPPNLMYLDDGSLIYEETY